MKLTNHTERLKFIHNYQVKDGDTLRKIIDGGAVSFVNVRHPFERLISAYLHFRTVRKKKEENKTFEQFIVEDILEKLPKKQNKGTYRDINPHWRPYNSFCAFCNINYDIVSKTETFEEDKQRAMDILGLENEQKGKRLNIHGGSDIKNKTRHFFKDVSEEHIAAIVNFYKYDFLMFDYNSSLE